MSEAISEETSKRICSHMNEDHAASVHGMVLNANAVQRGHISNCKLKKITLEGCSLSYVVCNEDMCQQHTIFIAFSPPLRSEKEARQRMILLHHQALSPRVKWLVIDPMAFTIIVASALLAYGTYGFGEGGAQGLATAVRSAKRLDETISSIWGSADTFARQVVFFWYFAITVHALEGAYVAYHAIRTFKLRLGSTLLWFYLVLCTGFPVAMRFLEFLKVHTSASKVKASKKKH